MATTKPSSHIKCIYNIVNLLISFSCQESTYKFHFNKNLTFSTNIYFPSCICFGYSLCYVPLSFSIYHPRMGVNMQQNKNLK